MKISTLSKYITIVLITLASINSLKAKSFNQLGIFFSPTLTYRTTKDNIGLNQKSAIRYDAGLTYKRAYNKRILYGLGVGYSKIGYTLKEYERNTRDQVDYTFYYNFFELPFLMDYNLSRGIKSSSWINVGLVNQLVISSGVKVEQSEKSYLEENYTLSDLQSNNMDMYSLALMAGYSYQIRINKKLNLQLSPYFKYSIIALNNVHPWNIGVKFGLGLTL